METSPPASQSPPAPASTAVARPAGFATFTPEAVFKKQGGTAVKVWGILLLIAALFATMNLVSTVMLAFGDGIDVSAFMIGQDDATKAEFREFVNFLLNETRSGPSFWISLVGQAITTALVFAAAVQLLRSRPSGRKLAIALGLIVFLTIPLTGHEMLRMNEIMMPRHEKFMRNMMYRELEKKTVKPTAPSGTLTPEEEAKIMAERKAAQQRQVEDVMKQMSGVMKIVNAVTVVLTVLFTLLIDGLLLFSMTRPKVKEYLENAAKYKDSLPPGFHPALGLPLYAPPAGVSQGAKLPPAGASAPGPNKS